MKSRIVASAAVSALVVLGATGCTFITPQSTTIAYPASDGVNISDSSGPVDVRNVIIVANEDGSVGNLAAALVNTADKQVTLTITVADLDPFTVTVPAGESLSLGAKEDPLRIVDLDAKPGATVEVRFQSGDGVGAKAEVPVLDGTLPYYADLVPTTPGDEESTPSPKPTDSETSDSKSTDDSGH